MDNPHELDDPFERFRLMLEWEEMFREDDYELPEIEVEKLEKRLLARGNAKSQVGCNNLVFLPK